MTSTIASRLHCLFGIILMSVHPDVSAVANTSPSVDAKPIEDPPLFPLADLKIGMEGVGYSVFSSVDGLEPFEFKVLGVMRDFLGPGQDLIIARVIGRRFLKSGVVAGMSGSPVYVDGKLLGAVSYGFGEFTNEAIAGITPIKDMLAAISAMPEKGSPKIASRASGQSRMWGPVKAISLPLVAQGLSPQMAEHFEPLLKQRGYGMLLPSTGSVGAEKGGEGKLYAGGPVAAVVVDGDMTLAAIGTVTWIKGNRFLGFGHPFLLTGTSEVPAATAEIVTTVFSQYMPFKLGRPIKVIGKLSDDRNTGIAGEMDAKPSTTALRVKMGTEQFNYKIARHPIDMPMFASIALGNSLQKRLPRELGGTYRMNIRMQLSNGAKVQVMRETSGYGVPMEGKVALLFMESVAPLVEQNLEQINIEDIDVEINYSDQVKQSALLGADVGTQLISGRTSRARLTFKPWQAPLQDKVFSVAIPMGLESGDYQVLAADRQAAMAFEREAGLDVVPQNYRMLLNQLQTQPKASEVCLYLQKATMSKRIDGYPLIGLPGSLRTLTSGLAVSPDATLGKKAIRLACVDLGWIMNGTVMGEVTVKNDFNEASSDAKK